MRFLPVSEPNLSDLELNNLVDAFSSTWISSKGKYIEKFEIEFAQYVVSKYSSTTANGTVSLHLILSALGIGRGDEVIVPTFTYIASVNAISYVGAVPVFVDSEPDTWNMDISKIEDLITAKTKAVIAVHIYGHSVDLGPLCKICDKHNIYLIEDAAEAIGTLYNGKHVGTFGVAGSFSFFGNKLITTGEGGMIVTSDSSLLSKINKLKNQGVSNSTKYWHDAIGYNYRMTNLQAAIGCAQLERIEDLLSAKIRNALLYRELLNVNELHNNSEKDYCRNSFWMNCILLDGHIKDKRDIIMSLLEHEYRIETRPFFYPAHILPMYMGYSKREYPICEDFYYRGINLPSSTKLSCEEVHYICYSLLEIIERVGE